MAEVVNVAGALIRQPVLIFANFAKFSTRNFGVFGHLWVINMSCTVNMIWPGMQPASRVVVKRPWVLTRDTTVRMG